MFPSGNPKRMPNETGRKSVLKMDDLMCLFILACFNLTAYLLATSFHQLNKLREEQ